MLMATTLKPARTLGFIQRAITTRLSFFFSSRRRHTRWPRDWSSDVCSSDLVADEPDRARSPAPERAQGPIPVQDETVRDDGFRGARHRCTPLAPPCKTPAPTGRGGTVTRLRASLDERARRHRVRLLRGVGHQRNTRGTPPARTSTARAPSDGSDTAPAADRTDQLRDPHRPPARPVGERLPRGQAQGRVPTLRGEGPGLRTAVTEPRQELQHAPDDARDEGDGRRERALGARAPAGADRLFGARSR